MRTRVLVLAVVTGLLVVSAPASAGVMIPPTHVLSLRGLQFDPGGNGTYLAWTQCSRSGVKCHALASDDLGATRFRLDGPGITDGAFGNMDDGTTAIYEQHGRGDADLYWFDLATQNRSPVAEVNTRKWESQPRFSDDFILFLRDGPRGSRLSLYDRNLHTTTVIAGNRGFPNSFEVDGVGSTYATFTICNLAKATCHARLYDIQTQTKTSIDEQADSVAGSAVVDEGHGVVYWVRSSDLGCDSGGFEIVRAPVGSLGTQTVLLDRNTGSASELSLAYDVPGNSIDLLFRRWPCRGTGDIWALPGIDTIT